MSTLSVAERRRIWEQQMRKQGSVQGSSSGPSNVAGAPNSVVGSPNVGGSPVQVDRLIEGHVGDPTANQNAARPPPPPPPEFHASKRAKIGPSPSIELGLSGGGEAITDMSWRNILKCQNRVDVSVDAPVRSAWDSRYPLNRVLNGAIGLTDVEKVASMGVGQIWLM